MIFTIGFTLLFIAMLFLGLSPRGQTSNADRLAATLGIIGLIGMVISAGIKIWHVMP